MIGLISTHLKGLLEFSGREARGVFWPWVGVSIALYTVAFMGIVALFLADVSTGESREPLAMMSNVYLMNSVACAVIVALLAASVARRLHDCNRRGAWGLLPIPNLAIGMILMPMVSSEAVSGAASEIDSVFPLLLNNMVYLAMLGLLVFLCAQPGTPDENRFGPPPPV